MAAQGLLSGRQLLGRPLQSSISRSSSSRKSAFVVRASSSPPAKQNDNRQLWFASKQSLTYLDGTLPGDFGFDPLGLSDPEGTGGFIEPRWLAYGEIFNGRTAMMGVVGMIAPGSMGKQYFLGLEKYLGGSGDPAYPGGPIFNPLGFGTKSEKEMKELKLKEIKNGRLAMLAFLGMSLQAIFTGVGPFQNLLDHLSDPVNNNILTSLKFH
ncbi:unnamed protein product [Triticum turgidum subsp. durum]|uniref:Chlorophyll a-b binding protein, chloroplastic n=1 Tax=Triticum turgidum subsp. durum TaxID=4567 RepID=A0A9R0YL87_TRITD|nr:unnamed protein product [Triticum turgidum subsp. durum]